MERGHVLASRYRLLSLQRAGGMGDVWRAEHVALRSPVAVKLLGSGQLGNEEAITRFFREAQAADWVRSPHVVQVLDYGSDEGVPFIVMELLEGETLAARLARGGKLGAVETARVVTHVARAISRAHAAGIVHRDLKPENVFLTHHDGEVIAKVLDFGVAKIIEADAVPLTRGGALRGTPAYMSPEQVCGREIDHRADIWALGMIAFECLLGRRAIEFNDCEQAIAAICMGALPVPSEIGRVPEGFDAWFATATAREPSGRFGSATDAAACLRALCDVPGAASSVRLASRGPPSDPDVRTPATLSLAELAGVCDPDGAPVSDVLQRSSAARRSGSIPVCAPEPPPSPASSDTVTRSGIEYAGRRRAAPILVEPPRSRRRPAAIAWVPIAAVATGFILLALAVLLALARR